MISVRPSLTKDVSLEDFQEFYWLKKELQNFCRRHGVATGGSKEDLTSRIIAFLRKENLSIVTKPNHSKKKTYSPTEPTLDTPIEENLACIQDLRAFFVSMTGPSFTFSVVFQKFLKQNVGKTYRDAVNFWKEERQRKKDPSYKTVIAPQFEYNQFVRNFFADSKNIGKTKKEALQAWMEFRNTRHKAKKHFAPSFSSSGNMRVHGPPPYRVAVIHGGPGGPGEMKSLAEELSKEYGVLEPLQTAHSIEGQILELKEMLEQQAVLPVILIGHSWGAWLSYLYAARYPGDVKKLILVSSPGFELSAGEKTLEERLRRLSEVERKRMKTLLNNLAHPNESTNRKFLELAILAAKADAFDPVPHTNDLLEAQFDIYQSVWKEAEHLRANGELLELGKKIICPTVALHGDHDPHPVQNVQEPLSRVLSHFRFISIKNCGHRPWIERQAKDEFYRILKEEIHL